MNGKMGVEEGKHQEGGKPEKNEIKTSENGDRGMKRKKKEIKFKKTKLCV